MITISLHRNWNEGPMVTTNQKPKASSSLITSLPVKNHENGHPSVMTAFHTHLQNPGIDSTMKYGNV